MTCACVAAGFSGFTGPTGFTGNTGDTGFMGATGATGVTYFLLQSRKGNRRQLRLVFIVQIRGILTTLHARQG